jgi:hypothetical protein
MKKIVLIALFLVALTFASAFAQGATEMDNNKLYSVKNYLTVVNTDSVAIAKGAPVIFDYAGAYASDSATATSGVPRLNVLGVSGTSSVLIIGIAEDTIAVQATGRIITYGYADVLFDTGGATAGASFGTGNTTKGEATSGSTGGGIVCQSRTGRGLAKCLVKIDAGI